MSARRLLFAPSPPAYLAGGIDRGRVVAAYEPKGAVSEADSLINRVRPGVLDAINHGAVWTAANGWSGNASNRYLDTGIALDTSAPGYTFIVSISGSSVTGRILFGAFQTGSYLVRVVNKDISTKIAYGYGSDVSSNEPYVATGTRAVLAVSSKTGYRDGRPVATMVTPITDAGTRTIFLLTNNNNGTPNAYSGNNILAFYAYKTVLTDYQVYAVSKALALL